MGTGPLAPFMSVTGMDLFYSKSESANREPTSLAGQALGSVQVFHVEHSSPYPLLIRSAVPLKSHRRNIQPEHLGRTALA
jgi:hypothetical protein